MYVSAAFPDQTIHHHVRHHETLTLYLCRPVNNMRVVCSGCTILFCSSRLAPDMSGRGIQGILNGMDLYKGQDLVLECENWRSYEREQTQIDGKL